MVAPSWTSPGPPRRAAGAAARGGARGSALAPHAEDGAAGGLHAGQPGGARRGRRGEPSEDERRGGAPRRGADGRATSGGRA